MEEYIDKKYIFDIEKIHRTSIDRELYKQMCLYTMDHLEEVMTYNPKENKNETKRKGNTSTKEV